MFRSISTFVVLFLCFAAGAVAQSPSPSPASTPSKQDGNNPFAPAAAPALPEGMTGADINDPRYKLTPGVYNAGETSMGLRHIALVKKPNAFQLGTDNPEDPKVKKTLGTVFDVSDPSKVPPSFQMVLAQLAFANSDIAFQGKHLFQGNFYGISIYDISDPAKVKLLTTMVCPGGQEFSI
jgi:hypothetical protein